MPQHISQGVLYRYFGSHTRTDYWLLWALKTGQSGGFAIDTAPPTATASQPNGWDVEIVDFFEGSLGGYIYINVTVPNGYQDPFVRIFTSTGGYSGDYIIYQGATISYVPAPPPPAPPPYSPLTYARMEIPRVSVPLVGPGDEPCRQPDGSPIFIPSGPSDS